MTGNNILSTTVVKPRDRRSKARIEQLQAQISRVLKQDHPQSVRHVFYRMTDPTLPEPVEKSEQGYRQIQSQITKMRRAGLIPYDWITDATRRGFHVNTYDDAEDFLRRVSGLYRSDLWQHADHYVEVWTESRSIAGVIEWDCEELAVSLYPAGGFSSITLAFQAAGQINRATGYGSFPAEILYIGDYDPAGVLIDQAVEKELLRHLERGVELNFHRIGINLDQIEMYNLPAKPRKIGDKRAQHVTETVEAEAMPAHILRSLLRDNIERFLPTNALAVARVAEESERAHLRNLADIMGEQ